MLRRHVSKAIAVLALVTFAGWLLHAADISSKPAPRSPAGDDSSQTNSTKELTPGPNDGRIAFAVAWLLKHNHYLQHPLDNEFSEKFFNRYFEELDQQHMLFTQTDLNEFAAYRTNLDNLTVRRNGEADTRPAFQIFDRFMDRLEQRVNYVADLLKHEKFEFNSDDRLPISRREAAYPRDLDEAKQLWRQRVRYEYLLEHLARISTKTNSATAKVTTPATNSTAGAEAPKKKTEAEEIADLLIKRYNRTLHLYKELDSDDVLERYLTALAHVYDPHSDYMNQSGADNFAIGMNLALFGIGAELFSSEDGYCTIRRLTPNGPAEKSKKIKANDRIVAVAQSNAPPVDVVDMNLNKVVQLIRGPKGTEVTLTVIPASEPTERRVFSLIRDEIKLEDQEAKAKIIELPDGKNGTVRLGVIDLPSFYATIDLSGRKSNEPGSRPTTRSTTADVARLLKKLAKENVKGVILDLRRNGGGSLEEATALSSLFVKGPIVQVRSFNKDYKEVAVLEDNDVPVLYHGPLVVLTSRGSASAAEILAGALQDYGRALLVGDVSTFGKGTVQTLSPLRPYIEPTATVTNDPGALKFTIRKYYRPSGTSTLFKGVLPDIVLPSAANYSEDIGEGALDEMMGNYYSKLEDTGSGNTLGRDSIESAAFDKLDLVQPYVADLLKNSSARISTNQDFTYLREDIELFRKLQADKTVSLNEKQQLKERAEAEARQKARDKERLARKESEQKIYELKLSQLDMPGLPPALTRSNLLARHVVEVFTPPKDSGFDASKFKVEYVTNDSAANKNITYVFDKDFTNYFGGNVAALGKVVTSIAVAADGKLKPAAEASATATDTTDDEVPPAIDTTLEEAESILLDYIKLLAHKNLLSSKEPGVHGP